MILKNIYKYSLYKLSLKFFLLIIAIVIISKYTLGAIAAVIILLGAWNALCKKSIYAIICFCLLPFIGIINPLVFNLGKYFGLFSRIGIPFLALSMFLVSRVNKKTNKHSIPMEMMILYIIISCISSINGYAPMISALKIINFSLFYYGIYWGIKNIEYRVDDLIYFRAFLIAYACFVIIGSFVINMINPFAAHYSAYGWHIVYEGIESAKNAMIQQIATTGETGYFCGILNHSQCLGTTTTCIAGWLLSDMLFIEKKLMPLHLALFILCPIILYMTYSRTSLLSFIVMLIVMSTVCVPKFHVNVFVKRRIRLITIIGLFFIIICSIIFEIRNNGMTKWTMKSNSQYINEGKVTVNGLLSSRLDIIKESIKDFKDNPIFGKGFQVSIEHSALKHSKVLILSAPIEKGFLPTMILGETGLLGLCSFIFFLFTFYNGCIKNEYWVTIGLFTTMIAANFGEATFFSPGGTGGPEWLFSLIGGYIIDINHKYNHDL